MSTIPPLSILPQVLDHLPIGMIVLDAAGRVVAYNETEAELAGRTKEEVLGKSFFTQVAPCMNVRELGHRFFLDIGQVPIDVEIDFAFDHPSFPAPRDVRVRMRSFTAEGAPYAMISIEDRSREREVERMRERLNELLVHDLKNPLSVIISALSFIDAVAPADLDLKEALEDGRISAERMQSMLLNLLDTTRLEAKAMPVNLEQVDARLLVEDAVRAGRAAARFRRVEIAGRIPTEPLFVDVDVELFRRCFENLIDNGVRYAKHLTIAVWEVGHDDVAFEVIDDGPGMPDSLRQQVFDRYAQASSNSHVNRGLGLTFVRLVAQAHGGTAEAECPPTGGTIFRITVPKAEAPASSRRAG